MATNIAVIYGEASKAIRRIIVSDTDDGLAAATHLADGEALLHFDYKTYSNMKQEEFHQALFDKGLATPERCVETDKDGNVLAVYAADPVIDAPIIQGNKIVPHAEADVGDSVKDGVFISKKPIDTTPPNKTPAMANAEVDA